MGGVLRDDVDAPVEPDLGGTCRMLVRPSSRSILIRSVSMLASLASLVRRAPIAKARGGPPLTETRARLRSPSTMTPTRRMLRSAAIAGPRVGVAGPAEPNSVFSRSRLGWASMRGASGAMGGMGARIRTPAASTSARQASANSPATSRGASMMRVIAEGFISIFSSHATAMIRPLLKKGSASDAL